MSLQAPVPARGEGLGKAETTAADSGRPFRSGLSLRAAAELRFWPRLTICRRRLCHHSAHQRQLYLPPSSQSTSHTPPHTTHNTHRPSQWPLNVSPTSSPTSPRARPRSSRCTHLQNPSPQLSPDRLHHIKKRASLADNISPTAPLRTPTMLSSHWPSGHP